MDFKHFLHQNKLIFKSIYRGREIHTHTEVWKRRERERADLLPQMPAKARTEPGQSWELAMQSRYPIRVAAEEKPVLSRFLHSAVSLRLCPFVLKLVL